MDILLKIGHKIKYLREKEMMSQEALAFKAEIDRTYISSVENGRRNLSIKTLERIAIALNVDIYIFLK
jgi:transcriptional regulator with XRE-family HTH domain